ncbi:TasA family protein [Cytobacillus firmus]|uniref:TasA family protein n=1 Tax=Cytobacillus firmus TaxID=1399 RepID=UPI001C93855D|nr:TasA family protein [Cytobacillus firmus]MBY6051978.1 M73 family metallopeptidase [Cytobacillus firmus]
MSIKKKLGLGVASAALGLSLVGGGTWAAFNDVETVDHSITAGVLDLSVSKQASNVINLDKMVPGDKIKRSFNIANNGNVDIKEVLLDINSSEWVDKATKDGKGLGNNKEDFLSQFKVTMMGADVWNFETVGGGTDLLAGITPTGDDGKGGSYISLADLEKQADGTFDITHGSGLPNGATDEDGKDFDKIWLAIEFVDKDLKDAEGEQLQNKYQGEGAKIKFTFEAIQRDGVERNNNAEDGNSGGTE